MPCRPSTSTRTVRRPPEASARARDAATVVWPVPPLPVTTCSRAGQPAPRLLSATVHTVSLDRGPASGHGPHITDVPAVVVDGDDLQALGGGAVVVGREADRDGERGL